MLKKVVRVIVIAGGLIATLAVFSHREPMLLQHSIPVMSARDWILFPYFWRTNNTLITLQKSNPALYFKLVEIDTETSKTKSLDKFNTSFANTMWIDSMLSPTDTIFDSAILCSLSPDSKWLLLSDIPNKNPSRPVMGITARINDTSYFEWSSEDGYQCERAWLQDSQHWIEWRPQDHKIVLFGLKSRGRERNITTAVHIGTSLIGTTPTNEVVTADLQETWQSGTEQLHTFTTPLNHNPTKSIEQTVLLPRPSQVFELALSPDGTRIAWLARCTEPKNLFFRILPWFRRLAQAQLWGIWSSRADGQELHLIGWLPMDHGADNFNVRSHYPQGLRWLPDGKHLSFVYQEVLYRVPSE